MQGRPWAGTLACGGAVLAAYLGVMVWLTWPLAGSLRSALPSSHFACRFDLPYAIWALAYETHALATAPGRFADANIFHPATSALFYGQTGIGALPLFAPVFLATGNPALAGNVTFLLGLALTATALHLVVRRWTASHLAGAVAAATLLANQWLIWDFVPTAPHWATLELLPVIALLAATPFTSTWAALRLVPVLAVQCATDPVYIAPAVLAPLAVLAALRLARRSTRAAALRLLVALGLTVVALSPIYGAYVAVRSRNPDLARQTSWVVTEASFPMPLVSRFFEAVVPLRLSTPALVIVALGAVAALWNRRTRGPSASPSGWRQGVLWLVVSGVLASPPVATVGTTRIRMPLGWAELAMPVLGTFRVPSRFGVSGLVGLAILCGVGFAALAGAIDGLLRLRPSVARVARTALAVAAVVWIYRTYVDGYRGFPSGTRMPPAYPTQPAPAVPAPFLAGLRASRAPLLELPARTGLGSEAEQALAMYHSISHWRPLLNGYSSYWPVGFPERMAEAARLPEPGALEHLVETTGLGAVWVHTQALAPERRAAWSAPPPPQAGHAGLVVVARGGPDVLYAVEPPPPGP